MNIQSKAKPNSLPQVTSTMHKQEYSNSFWRSATGGREWENVAFLFHPIPSPSSHSHSYETFLAIPIPMGILCDLWDPWQFPAL